MATLNEQRFKELAYELMVEIENRFPEVLERQVKESRHSPRSQYPESQRDQRNENSTRERDVLLAN